MKIKKVFLPLVVVASLALAGCGSQHAAVVPYHGGQVQTGANNTVARPIPKGALAPTNKSAPRWLKSHATGQATSGSGAAIMFTSTGAVNVKQTTQK